MSNEVKRFSPEYCEAGGVGWAEMQEDAEGAWCKASDYDALEAECERLRTGVAHLVQFTQQMARQQGEPYYQKLAKAALKRWSGL